MAKEVSIVEMSDDQIISFLNSYDNGVKAKVLDFNNEYDFSNETLFNIVSGVNFLAESGAMTNAEELFSEIYKKSINELKSRLGNLPTIS